MRKLIFAALLTALIGFTIPAYAALQNNGNGLIYDTDLNITWYDYTKNFNNWSNQKSWAATLSVTDVNGKSITGWRLPSTVDGPFVWSYNGTTTAGYNITTSELGHLFYTEFGNKGYYDVNGNYQPDYGLTNRGPFSNLQSGYYWSGTEHSMGTYDAWYFGFYYGVQGTSPEDLSYYALAVHSGNVGAPVPIPGAILLFAPGLAGIAILKRRIGRRG
jgi:hypothetical protein